MTSREKFTEIKQRLLAILNEPKPYDDMLRQLHSSLKPADLDFVTHAPEDILWLTEMVERQSKQIDDYKLEFIEQQTTFAQDEGLIDP